MRPPTAAPVPPVPIQEAVSEFISALVGMGAAASKVTPSEVEAEGEHIIAAFKDDLGKVAAVVTADLPLAAATGAALAMIPAAAVKEAVDQGALTDTLLENFREVANMTASLLNTPATPHLSLIDAWPSNDEAVLAEAWTVLNQHTKRREYAVTIDGYGSGRLGIIIR